MQKQFSSLFPSRAGHRVRELPLVPPRFIYFIVRRPFTYTMNLRLLAYFRSALYDGQLQISLTNPVRAARRLPNPEFAWFFSRVRSFCFVVTFTRHNRGCFVSTALFFLLFPFFFRFKFVRRVIRFVSFPLHFFSFSKQTSNICE